MNVAFTGAANGPDHFAEIDELQKTQADGEEDTNGQKAVDEDITPENRVEKIDNCSHG